jgi:hypothetical protein
MKEDGVGENILETERPKKRDKKYSDGIASISPVYISHVLVW